MRDTIKSWITLLKKRDRTPIKILDDVCGVEVDPDISELDGEFSSEARLYGNVTLDEEEKQALELPQKFGVYRKLDPVQCKIDVEESLNKLRWNRIFAENSNRNVNQAVVVLVLVLV